jgi:hypothetical protein
MSDCVNMQALHFYHLGISRIYNRTLQSKTAGIALTGGFSLL